MLPHLEIRVIRSIRNWAKFALPAFALALVVLWANFALANPTQNPPGGNVTLTSSQWTTSGSNIYYTTGNIAVGTTTVGYPLTVSGGADSLFGLFRSGATYPTIFKQGTDGALVINNANSDVLTLKSGNLSIGTSTTLHTFGSAGKTLSLYDGTADNIVVLELAGNNPTGGGSTLGMITFNNTNSAEASKRVAQITSLRDGSDNAGSLRFSVFNSSASMIDALHIDSNGNVGIGTAAPSYKLHSLDTGNNTFAAYFQQTNASASNGILIDTQTQNAADKALLIRTNAGASTTLVVTNSGNVGIGTASPGTSLDITSATGNTTLRITAPANQNPVINMMPTTGNYGAYIFYGTAAGSASFLIQSNKTGAGYGIVQDADGKVGIGTASPGQKLDVVGTIRQTGAINCDIGSNASGDVLCLSDERVKDVKGIYLGSLDVINGISPIRFNFKGESYEHVGFSAQNVQKVLPEATPVQGDGYLGLDSKGILSASVNSIKELDQRTRGQQKEIDELKAENAELRQEISELEARIK